MAHIPEVQTVDIVHEHIHHGITFNASYKVPDGAEIADNAVLNVLVVTGRRQTHMTFEVTSGGDAEVMFFEGTTTSNNGTGLKSHNMNRDTGLMTPTTNIMHTPTITNDGELIYNGYISGGIGAVLSAGGVVRPGTEWILKRNTKYCIRYTNRSGAAQPASIACQFYELETPE